MENTQDQNTERDGIRCAALVGASLELTNDVTAIMTALADSGIELPWEPYAELGWKLKQSNEKVKALLSEIAPTTKATHTGPDGAGGSKEEL